MESTGRLICEAGIRNLGVILCVLFQARFHVRLTGIAFRRVFFAGLRTCGRRLDLAQISLWGHFCGHEDSPARWIFTFFFFFGGFFLGV